MSQQSRSYSDFIASKHVRAARHGFDVSDSQINQRLFDWQRQIARWALRVGRAALFEDCVTGDTIISGPDGDERIDILADRGRPVAVFSLDGNQNPIVASATCPWMNGCDKIYRLSLESGREIKATKRHRVLTRDGWKMVGEISAGEQLHVSDASRLRSTLESARLAHAEGVLGFQGRLQDSRLNCFACSHPCGEQLQNSTAIAQGFSPSQVDARERNLRKSHEDDRSRESSRSRLCLSIDRLPRQDCSQGSRTYCETDAESQVASLGSRCLSSHGQFALQYRRREHLLQQVCGSDQCHLENTLVGDQFSCSDLVELDTVTAVDYIGMEVFYDIHVPEFENYLANGLWSHNCGLGKTLQQLEWASQVCRHTGGDVLLLCPPAVQWQTSTESVKFGIATPAKICESQADVVSGITITNYEKLHKFDTSKFVGVVLDESSILKSYTGKTKQALVSQFSQTPYRLACTATPAPNDRMELGNHAEFLGVMPSNEMLARWFVNSGDKVGAYRLRKHGEADFWRWVASWAVCISSPNDIGFDSSGYILPSLEIREHVIESGVPAGYLFAPSESISATNVHQEKRAALAERASVVASLVNNDSDPWVIWCDTDYEADAIAKLVPDAVEVRGSHAGSLKESRLIDFINGKTRVLITKSEIAGFGLNFQHCHKTTWFAGYSYERWYQAIRRFLRYGQTHTVECHVVRTEREESIMDAVRRKTEQHQEMSREMAGMMQIGMAKELGLAKTSTLQKYEPARSVAVPGWLQSKGLEV